MDDFDKDHLERWLARYGPVETARARALIHAMVREHPVVLERGDSWPEILALAERNYGLGLLTLDDADGTFGAEEE